MSRRLVPRFAIVLGMVATGLGAQSNPNFGTAQTTYITLGSPDFMEVDSSDTFERFADLIALSGTGEFQAIVHLPSGALLTYLELDYCDTNTHGNDVGVILEDCPKIGNCPGGNVISNFSSTANGCSSKSADISSANYTVDNLNRRLFLIVALPSLNATNAVSGVILGYKLQVSPPPVAPTFNDVPITHPFFQYIEALANSGITGGCGGGNFCPDSPVTRGQMAVFLAKALGLQWN